MTDKNLFLERDQKIVGDIYTSRETMDNLLMLCDEFGSRFGGTEGEKNAADYMKTKMEEYGLKNVRLEPVTYTGWRRGEISLEITAPIQKNIPCISLPHSPPADLEGSIIDLGDGAPQDFDRLADKIKGNIVMTTSVVRPEGTKRWIHRNEKYGRALLAGATGFIFVNHYPGFGPATGDVGEFGTGLVPGLSVSKENGDYLKRLLKKYGEVKIRIKSTDIPLPHTTSWNVVGEIPGKINPEQYVLLGCHYDGHDISQGAVDPASGAVSVLEAARVLARYAGELPISVHFALWAVEEIGLFGSSQYVQDHLANLENIRFYLNMDSAGSSTNTRDIILNEWPELETFFKNASEEMNLDFLVVQSLIAFSDHFPFFLEGVPTGGIQSGRSNTSGRGYGHTAYDTVDKVEIKCLREASALAARLAMRIASAENWPVNKREKSEVQDLLNTPEYQEEEAYRQKIAQLYKDARN